MASSSPLSQFLYCLTNLLLPLKFISQTFTQSFLAPSLLDLVECSICLGKIRVHERSKELRCKHIFHKYCLERWMKQQGKGRSTCPLCRNCLDSSKKKAKVESSFELTNGGEKTTIFFSPFNQADDEDGSTWWLR